LLQACGSLPKKIFVYLARIFLVTALLAKALAENKPFSKSLEGKVLTGNSDLNRVLHVPKVYGSRIG